MYTKNIRKTDINKGGEYCTQKYKIVDEKEIWK